MALTKEHQQGIVDLAIDTYNNRGKANFSENKGNKEIIFAALHDAAGGATVLKYKDASRGAYNQLFEIIEQVLTVTVNDGIENNAFINAFAERHDLSEGDATRFTLNPRCFYTVSEMARGNNSVTRQRMHGQSEVRVFPTRHGIKIWEHMERVLSGRIDFNKMIEDATKSFIKARIDEAYACFTDLPNNLAACYKPLAGTYSERNLLDIITDIQVENDAEATILGTKLALQKLNVQTPGNMSDLAKDDLYKMGYFGNFYGTKCIELKQSHIQGSRDRALPDNAVWVFTGDQKPIKEVYEGDSEIRMGDPMDTADNTQEYGFFQNYGMKNVLTEQFGFYQFT